MKKDKIISDATVGSICKQIIERPDGRRVLVTLNCETEPPPYCLYWRDPAIST